MKARIILMILLPLSAYLFAQDSKLYIYYPDFTKDESVAGFMDANGKIVIPAGKYADIYTAEFDNVAFVAIKDKKGIYAIDRNEHILFQVCNYEVLPDRISNGLFRIIENGKIGFANMNGQIVIKPQFCFVYPLQKNGYAIFCKDGIWVKVDNEHTVVKGKWGAIDKKGTIIIPAIYENGTEHHLKKDGKRYVLNGKGELELK